MTAYLTLAEAKAWLGLDPAADAAKDQIINDLIAAVTESINSWTESNFSSPQVVLTTAPEIHDARRQDILIPKGYPLLSVEEVKIGVAADGSGGAVLPATEYNFDEVEIRLRSTQLPLQRGAISIAYTWGYAAVPARIKQAAKIAVEGYYRMRARQSVGVTSKAKEGETISYKGSWDAEAGLPREAVSILAGFRRLEFPDGAGGQMATRNN